MRIFLNLNKILSKTQQFFLLAAKSNVQNKIIILQRDAEPKKVL
jgi:hypothetical protein